MTDTGKTIKRIAQLDCPCQLALEGYERKEEERH